MVTAIDQKAGTFGYSDTNVNHEGNPSGVHLQTTVEFKPQQFKKDGLDYSTGPILRTFILGQAVVDSRMPILYVTFVHENEPTK